MNLLAVNDAIDAAIMRNHAEKDKPRGHLGFSRIGYDDSRTLWLDFRWSLPSDFTARTLRIFQAGHDGETTIINLLKQAGFQVWDMNPETGQQWRVTFCGGHFSGSADGIIKGLPGFEDIPHLLEIKTAKASKFKEFVRKGVKQANPVYWYQVQGYAAQDALNLPAALFIVLNKDTSEIYAERVEREPGIFDRLHQKAAEIIASDTPPASIYKDKTWFELKYHSDAWNAVYWGEQLPAQNCRNCRHSCPIIEGHGARWYCRRYAYDIPLDFQRTGCIDHNYLPAMMPADFVSIHDKHNAVEYRTREEKPATFFNSSSGSVDNVYNSLELEQISKNGLTAATVADKFVGMMRESFGARVVKAASEPTF